MDNDNTDFELDLDFDEMGAEDLVEVVTASQAEQYRAHKRREVKQRLESLKEEKWFKRRNWFDDEDFFDLEEIA